MNSWVLLHSRVTMVNSVVSNISKQLRDFECSYHKETVNVRLDIYAKHSDFITQYMHVSKHNTTHQDTQLLCVNNKLKMRRIHKQGENLRPTLKNSQEIF